MMIGKEPTYLFCVPVRMRGGQKYVWLVELRTFFPESQSKAVTGLWLEALHVSLATAVRGREKEERSNGRQSQDSGDQFPGSGLWSP